MKTVQNYATGGAISKQAATVLAVAALARVRVDRIYADNRATVFVVSRWSLTRECATLDEVRALLRPMGVEA